MTPTRLRRAGLAAGAGVLLALARPPFDVGVLALVALVPLFWAWRTSGPRGRAAYAFLAGVVYHGISVSWAWYFGAVAIVPFVAVLAGYWALVGAASGWFATRGFRSPLLIAALWVLAEWAVARFPLEGFSWDEVGYTLHDLPTARDVASVGGVLLVSALVVAWNGFLADLLAGVHIRAGAHPAVRATAGMVGIAIVTGTFVVVRPQPTPTGTLRVAIVQGNDKNRPLTVEEKEDRYLPRSHFALAAEITEPVDLIILPESSLDEDPRTDAELARELQTIARDHDAWVLANAVADAPDGRAVNLNLLYGPDGELQGTYAKRHLVPYGERVPYRDLLDDFIGALDRVPRDFEPGKEPGRFDIAGIDVATVICFESAFGAEVRPLVRDGAEVVVVSTNNRSYRRSANSAQHLAIGQMRAAETGRPVVQAAISGISAFIDASGRVHGRTELFERTVLRAEVTATRGSTLYVRWGEWIAGLALLTVIACGAGALIGRRRSVDSPDRSVVPSPASTSGEPA